MERTLNQPALEQYSQTFSERVIEQAYAHQDRVSGQGILSLAPVKQVNFFVIKALFDQWQHEIESLKSPYFDYDNEEVQSALEEFVNVLSQHILVAKTELKPLVQAAARDTLQLLLAPSVYYRQALDALGHDRLFEEDGKDWIKYVKINRSPLQHLNDQLAARAEGISKDEADQLLQEAARDLTPENPSAYLSELSEVAALSEEEVVLSTTDSAPASPEPDLPFTASEPIEEVSPSPGESSTRTLNDELSPSQRATLADLHRQQKIENIKTYIGVNQRFMFVRELFDNNAEEYNRALDELEQKNTYIEAFNHLRNEYAQPHRWKMDSEEVVEFLEIVAKRF